MKHFRKILRIFKKKSVVFLLIIVILVVTAFLVIRTLNKPAIGVVSQSVDQQSASQNSFKEFKNKYFTTQYPSRYDLQKNKNPSASIESWMLVSHQSIGGYVSSNIAVSLNKMPVGGVKEESSYKLFTAYPKIYTISRATYNLDSVIIGSKTDTNYENTALWSHGDYLLIISMSSGQKTSQLESEMDTFLSKLVWAEQ